MATNNHSAANLITSTTGTGIIQAKYEAMLHELRGFVFINRPRGDPMNPALPYIMSLGRWNDLREFFYNLRTHDDFVSDHDSFIMFAAAVSMLANGSRPGDTHKMVFLNRVRDGSKLIEEQLRELIQQGSTGQVASTEEYERVQHTDRFVSIIYKGL
ncbi:hypothetical protein N0V90_013176 [Kalmusia sp. IMI 367209]|nr:hypothetical protein N0V90_013176 [Kalmusia sp. IMI 367209]